MEVVGALSPRRPRSSLPIPGSVAEEGRHSSYIIDLEGSISSGKVELSKGDGQKAALALGFLDKFVSDVNQTIPTIED